MTLTIEDGTRWFVWTKSGRRPRAAHADETAAIAEASRLAKKFPGQKFHVLRSVAKVHCVPESPISETVAEAANV